MNAALRQSPEPDSTRDRCMHADAPAPVRQDVPIKFPGSKWVQIMRDRYLGAAWLVFILLLSLRRLWRAFPAPTAELNSDARWTYLPNARKLIDSPWHFLTTDPSSYHVAPLGYAWPAVWGADPFSTQVANCLLFLLSLTLLWRCATRLGGITAGIVATSLALIHPEFHSYIPQVLTESLFLFGLMLLITGTVEYFLSIQGRLIWLASATLGLTITLLSRPVLQLLAIAAFFASLVAIGTTIYLRKTHPHKKSWDAHGAARHLSVALAIAFAIPTAVVLKNGYYFGVWGLGTGAGTGLFYGLSPFKMGLEPVYSNFSYDAGRTASEAAPDSNGNPLHYKADRIHAQAALEIIKNTTLADNLSFFTHKLHAWLFYSTPELQVSYKLRAIRLFEWLSIITAGILLTNQNQRKLKYSANCKLKSEKSHLLVLSSLLAFTLLMVSQLVPVLYNTRYNSYFIEPPLMLLCGVAVSIIASRAMPTEELIASKKGLTPFGFSTKTFLDLGVLGMLVVCSIALARYAKKNEAWSMDPYRPGPTKLLLDQSHFGHVYSRDAAPISSKEWRLNSGLATLWVPIYPSDSSILSQDRSKDALWRVRFAVTPSAHTHNSCKTAKLQVMPSYPSSQPWFKPNPTFKINLEGIPTTYAFHGNDELRPNGNGLLGITFFCPPGTLVSWEGIELRQSTMPEAVKAFIHTGKAIDPYLPIEPPVPAP